MHWRSPKTAPRDGTIIVGLFQRKGKRSIAFHAAFGIEDYRRILKDPAPSSAASWVKDSEDDALHRYRTDPSFGFRPISDSDEAIDVGQMLGWRPLSKRDAVIRALTAAGWRLVGPDEVDPVTVERCIAIVEAKAPKDTGEWCPYRAWAVGSIPYLRAIASGGKP